MKEPKHCPTCGRKIKIPKQIEGISTAIVIDWKHSPFFPATGVTVNGNILAVGRWDIVDVIIDAYRMVVYRARQAGLKDVSWRIVVHPDMRPRIAAAFHIWSSGRMLLQREIEWIAREYEALENPIGIMIDRVLLPWDIAPDEDIANLRICPQDDKRYDWLVVRIKNL